MVNLDVGCGSRPWGDVNVDLFPESNVFRPAQISSLEQVQITNFVHADACHLPFRSGSFGISRCRMLIQHVDDPYLLLKEMVRVSRDKIIVEYPHRLKGRWLKIDKWVPREEWFFKAVEKIGLPRHTPISTENVSYKSLRLFGKVMVSLPTMARVEIDADPEPVKFVYTVCDKGDLIKQVTRSIRSLLKFTTKENIIVFYTPPRSTQNYLKLSNIATLEMVPNITEPFVFRDGKKGRYGEKVHLCDVECPNVIFLDADTFVNKNPVELLGDEYDFSARPGSGNKFINVRSWAELLSEHGQPFCPMPNTGFMIFKNFLHKKIRDEWLELINDPDLPNPHTQRNPKEQIALALAVADKRIRWMSRSEHAFKWRGERGADSYVIHYGKKSRFHGFAVANEKVLKVWKWKIPIGFHVNIGCGE